MIAYAGCFVVALFSTQQSGQAGQLSRQGVQKAKSARGSSVGSSTPYPANGRRRQTPAMANSRFQYVKKFELSDALLPDTYLIARLDGHRFTKFTKEHGFSKPNDERGLLLMAEVMSEWSDLVMAFGQSDEFSFLLPASSPLYGRRSAKLSTSFVSLFSSSFVFFWPKHFPDTPLLYPPNFDARIVSYPTAEHVRDYFAWRQADCHINNLYNTCFWALVGDGVSKQDAQVALKGTTSGDKNELLFSRFGTNYNEIPQRFRKGTTLFRARPTAEVPPLPEQPRQTPPDGGKAANAAVKDGIPGPPVEKCTVPEGADGVDASAIQQSRETGEGTPALAAADPSRGSCSPVDDNPITGFEREDVPKGAEAGRPAPGTGRNDKISKIGEKGKTDVVRVVSSGDGKGRTKRLLKKGHAPPGTIEEAACDLIRDDFWERNPHILGGGATRR